MSDVDVPEKKIFTPHDASLVSRCPPGPITMTPSGALNAVMTVLCCSLSYMLTSNVMFEIGGEKNGLIMNGRIELPEEKLDPVTQPLCRASRCQH